MCESIRYGRTYLACNSIFVAMIRYLYIVHYQKLNQYEFRNVAGLFQITSVAIPVAIEALSTLTFSADFCKWKAFNENLVEFGSTSQFLQKETVEWSLKYLPEAFVSTMSLTYVTAKILIVSNVIEGYLYFKMFQNIER